MKLAEAQNREEQRQRQGVGEPPSLQRVEEQRRGSGGGAEGGHSVVVQIPAAPAACKPGLEKVCERAKGLPPPPRFQRTSGSWNYSLAKYLAWLAGFNLDASSNLMAV